MSEFRGPLAWMARNHVAANVAMVVLLLAGAISALGVKKEVFPEFELDMAVVQVTYPGASPEEVEQGVILPIEEALSGLDGIDRISSVATESNARVNAYFLLGEDRNTLLSDIKTAVDRIPRSTLPADIEEPVVSLLSRTSIVLTLAVYGEPSEIYDCPEGHRACEADRDLALEQNLRRVTEEIREDLLQLEDITQVEISGLRDYEISIEIPEERLRAYGLTLQDVASRIRIASVEIPAGEMKTERGAILLRTTERKEKGADFEDIVLRSLPDGSQIRIGDIATVKDAFADNDLSARFQGKPAGLLQVYRVGEQTPITVSDAVKGYIEDRRDTLPEGLAVDLLDDRSDMYRGRIGLLLKNGWMGLILVLVILGSFLEPRLAFWVTMGIPISFIGAFVFLPSLGVSVNMVSLFAFIMTLGIVVDDAIVVGEASFDHIENGESPARAAVLGVKEISTPVIFSVLTTIIAFSPLLGIPGTMGKFFKNIPLVGISVLFLSLIESLLILPAHLGHSNRVGKTVWPFLADKTARWRKWVSAKLQAFINGVYRPVLEWCLNARYATMVIFISLASITFGMCRTGVVGRSFLPTVERDTIDMSLVMPFGTSVSETRRWTAWMEDKANEVATQFEDQPVRGVYTLVGGREFRAGPGAGATVAGSHLGMVRVFLHPSGDRDTGAGEFVSAWRKAVGEIPGAESTNFRFKIGPGGDASISYQLAHADPQVLSSAAARLAAELALYAGVTEVDDGYEEGKPQRDMKITAEGLAAGLNETEVGRQLRAAFFGVEATRQQRGRNEVRTYVRYPRSERESEATLEGFVLQTPSGGEIPLHRAVSFKQGRSYTQIDREDARRVLTVTADLEDPAMEEGVKKKVEGYIETLQAGVPGLKIGQSAEGQEREDVAGSLLKGGLLAIAIMLGLMAIALRSYFQPLIIIMAIPFGIAGAIYGHALLGFNVSFVSQMGMVALAGIVVNDSLVLVDALNRFRKEGMALEEAIIAAGTRRFRPILLTTLTTFFGLIPMLLEQSTQAKFLIPMAVSLAFGVLLATVVTLLLVPAVYRIGQDFSRFFSGLGRGRSTKVEGQPSFSS